MKRDKNSRLPPGDDGRTIADMNVDGMPWYTPPRSTEVPEERSEIPKFTKEEARRYTWAAVRAGIVIVLVFGAVFALFIAFCDFVWFR